MKVKVFTFNPFYEKTYILFDETKEAVLIDPGCFSLEEEQELQHFIQQENLRIKFLLNTHCHLDHVFGNEFICKHYQLLPQFHEKELMIFRSVPQHASIYGFHNINLFSEPIHFLKENDEIIFGNQQKLKVIFVPGHSLGHIAFYHEQENALFSGDVLFKNSVGRTDLPGSDVNDLLCSIFDKLYLLPENTIVFPGHGETTTIGAEKLNNPYTKR
ncbi:MAG: MBL fold metallo-hydrolase [Bacteroidota bacterium]